MRLGLNGAWEIKAHPFFRGINWKDISTKDPPFVPSHKDISNFENFEPVEEQDPWWMQTNNQLS